MTFKELLYKCYTQRAPIGAGSKGQRVHVILDYLLPSGYWDLTTNIQTK